jgi:hypothetical protein
MRMYLPLLIVHGASMRVLGRDGERQNDARAGGRYNVGVTIMDAALLIRHAVRDTFQANFRQR